MGNANILVVEDDGAIVVRLKRMLIRWGYGFASASSGEKALEMAVARPPDLVLMDIFLGMKGMDGVEAARTLKDRFGIPAIYLTAYADESLLQRAKETEPYGYLVKPIQELELRAMLEMALAKKALDNRVKESEERLRTALDAVGAGGWRLDARSGELDMDDRFREMLGYGEADAPSVLDESLCHPDDWPAVADRMAAIRRGEAEIFKSEHRMRTAEGGWKWVSAWAKASLRTADWRPERLYGAAIDIDDRKAAEARQRKLEAQLRQSQKMEAVGQLAGGVAHDFNNLLYVIMGYGDMMRDGMPPESPFRKNIDEIMKAAERAKNLVRQLLLFSRKESMQPRPLDLNRLIADLTKMLRRLIGEHIRLDVTPGADLKTIRADPGQIEQVVVNLCVNARDAMPDGGRIAMETGNCTLEAALRDPYGSPKAGEFVCLTVSDTGEGMSPEVREKVFEPFFTTKEVGKGTGLGLAAAYGIVKSHGGVIRVASETGQGSVFRVYLPAVPQGAPDGAAPEEIAASALGKETVLVAEDEASVRDFTVQLLRRSGYRVISTRDGGEAVRAFEEAPDAIDLALLDVVMPHVSGRKVYEVIRARRPDLPVLFITGYSKGMLPDEVRPGPRQDMIQKPMRPGTLLRKVRDMIDGPADGR